IGRSSGRPKRSSSAARKKLPPAMPPMKKYSTISQRQCGAAVKKVSDVARPQTEKPKQPEHHGTQGRPQRTESQVARRQLRIAGEAVGFRLVNEQIEGIQAP